MEINKQSLALVEYLYENNGSLKIEQVCRHLHLSKRSLFYQIDKINDFFRANHIKEMVSANQSVILSMEEQNRVEEILFSPRIKNSYFLSVQERLAVITLIIAVNKVPCTTESLCQMLDISKNTLVTDIKTLKKTLRNVGLFLLSSNKTGYALGGDEMTVRFYLLECMHMFYENKYSKYYIHLVYQELFQDRYDESSYKQLYEQVMQIFNQDKYARYTKDALEEIFVHLTLMILRKKVPETSLYREDESTKTELKLAKILIDEIRKTGFCVPQENEKYLMEILLSSKRQQEGTGLFFEENLMEHTERFVENFEKLAMIHLENKKERIKKLLLHIRPMYYRMKYGIRIYNALTEEIQKKYSMFYHLTKKALELTEQSYYNMISEDELAYLCIYFAGWVNQSVLEIEKVGSQYKILLVVSDGNSTSSLIQLQLANLLKPMHFQYEVLSSQQFSLSMAEEYSLIVGDVSNVDTCPHIIPVSAILTESQRNRILQWSIKFSDMNNDEGLKKLYDMIKMHCTIHDEEILKVKLFTFLNESGVGESSQIPSLRQTITKKDVFLFSERMRIEELLVAMTRELILRGTVKTLYPVNVLHLLNTMGAYGEIAKGVLLLHAEDVSYCNHLGLSIGNLKYPLTFSQNTHEIHTVVLLSTPDKLSHLRILKNLSQLFRDADFLKQLEEYQFLSEDKMYEEIQEKLLVEE